MPTPSSGQINFSDLKTEWNDSNPVNLSEFYAGGTYVGSDAVNVPSSGQINISNLYNLYNMWTSGVTGLSAYATVLDPVIDSSNNIYLCVAGPSGSFVLMKMNSNGVLQWQYQYAATVNIPIYRMQRDSNNNIYICGYVNGLNVSGRADAALIKIDSNGTFQWCRSFRMNSFTGTPTRTTLISDIGIDGSNNIYCAGSYVSPDVNNRYITHLTKIDSSGTVQWYKGFEVQFGSSFPSMSIPVLGVDSSGTCYIGSTARGISFIKFDSSGTFLSYVNYDSNPATRIAVDGNGYLNCSSNILPGVFQLDSSFNYRWAQQQTTGSGSYGGIFLDSSNNVYVTSSDFGTFVKFNNSGTLQWQRINKLNIGFGDGGYDVFSGVVDSSGNLYTGMFGRSASPYYAFIKKYPSNVYLPVSSVNVFSISGPLTYKYQTSSFSFGSATFPNVNTGTVTYNVISPDIFDQYSNSLTRTTPSFTALRINSAY